MSEYPIDDVHRLLDLLEEFIPEIDELPEQVHVYALSELTEVILELLDGRALRTLRTILGLTPRS